MTNPIPTKEHFSQAYKDKRVSSLKWVSGAPSSELISLVWNQVILPGSRVLEVGCGIGTEAVFLAVHQCKVTAIDISQECLDIARHLSNTYDVGVDFQQADVLQLPFREAEFDVICDRGCFHCFKETDQLRFVHEISRVCKPEGLFILRCFSERNPVQSWVIPNTSSNLISLFSKTFDLEHLERITSFSKPDNTRSEAWYSIWKRLPHI